MKKVSWALGVLGILIGIVAVVGRFHGQSAVWILGHAFTAGAILLVGNTVLLLGLFAGLIELQRHASK